jgi:DNA-binding MarR family transcriptional regulator
MTDLSQPQELMLTFLRDFASQNGYAPTRREIADALGYKSGNAAHEMLQRLERKGLIRLDKNQSRSIHVFDTVPKPKALAPITDEDFRLTKIREAIYDRNPAKAHALLIGNAEKFADAFIGDTLPASKSAQFLFRNLSFVEAHLSTLFAKVEGRSGAAKKTTASIRILMYTFLPSDTFNSDDLISNIEIATGKTFRVQSELFRFFDAIKDLHGGCGDRYFDFLRNHAPTKRTLSSDRKSQQAVHSR